jgi:hypothetical protein
MIKANYAIGLLSAIVLFVFSGCGPRYGDFFPYHDDGSLKPHVVLLPISDMSGNSELAEELMQGIRQRLMDNADLYIYSEESVNGQLDKAELTGTSFFTPDISYANKFGGADFVVATEIVECKSDLYGDVADKCLPRHLKCKDQFKLKLRMRVIDMRCEQPTVVLLEVFGRNYLHPNRRSTPEEVDRSCFDRVSYSVISDFVQRLEEIAWRPR